MRLIFTLCALLMATTLFSQANREKYQLHIRKTDTPVTLDGVLDDAAWQDADAASNFTQSFPTDSLPATLDSRIMVSFDDEFIYFAGYMVDDPTKKMVVESLQRDFDFGRNENFSIYFDPFDDYTNGFTFGITPAGVQREGIVVNGFQVRTNWDNKWYSEVVHHQDHWIFEMAIPFKSIRYNAENRNWNIVFLRNDAKNVERSVWAPVPLGYRSSSFAYGGQLIFDDPLTPAGTNISLIPYALGEISKDHEDGENTKYSANAGFDAKIGISSALNLDITVNPDFSQAEVDRQVTNLNRFELFFPERRQFFLENSDLFAQNGFPESRPFFSRRIGISTDEDDDLVSVAIPFGVRLSGKIGNKYRVGLLNMTTAKSDDANLPVQNYTTAIVQKTVFTNSNISFLFVNKQSFGVSLSDTARLNYNEDIFKEEVSEESDTSYYLNNYNRVFGADFNLNTPDNRWQGNFYFHYSLQPENNDDSYSTGGFLSYQVPRIRAGFFYSLIGTNYTAEVGFVPRQDIFRKGAFLEPFFYPKKGKIQRHGPEFNYTHISDTDFNKTDERFSFQYELRFRNSAIFQFRLIHNYVLLRDDFELIDDAVPLPEGTDYNWRSASLEFTSNRNKVFNWNLRGQYGGFYNGDRFQVSGFLNYRFQPFVNLAFNYSYNNIRLPDEFGEADFWLIGPNLQITFTDKLFWSTFLQFNNQNDNININSRFQWRFKPASDIFLVYSDNYFPAQLQVKNRSIVLKISYWLNV